VKGRNFLRTLDKFFVFVCWFVFFFFVFVFFLFALSPASHPFQNLSPYYSLLAFSFILKA